MSHVNWGLISTGFEFQALCGSLLGLEQPAIEQFSALGPDRGVDAFLPSDSAIYQYKFHKEPTNAKVKKDALDELSELPARKAKGDRYWSSSKKWILVTNIEANPQLREMWNTDIIPLFAKEGLVAELITKEQLEGLLIKHPSVTQAYFEKLNRTFITLNESIEKLKARRIQEQDIDNAYIGRDADLNAFRKFVIDAGKSLLVVTGPGGVGKSRFLIECAKVAATENQLSVYWANTETMESSPHWTAGIPTGKNVALFIDEPSSPQTIRVLLEQIQTKGSAFSQWKIVISVRSQNSQMIEALSSKKEEQLREKLELNRLSEGDLTSVAEALLSASPVAKTIGTRMKEISTAVGKASQGFPIWTVVAARLIQDKGSFADLPKDQWDIAKAHVTQAVASIPATVCDSKQANTILNWIALLGEIHTEDQKVIDFLKSEIGETEAHKVIEILNALADRKVLQEIGRLRRIKPDVIRDHLLLSLLVSERTGNAVASAYSKDLCKRTLKESNPIPHLDNIISSLNHVELLQKLNDHPVELLTPIISALREFAIQGTSVQQYSALELTKKFAYSRPRELLEICRSIRLTPTPPSEISDSLWGRRTVEHKTALLELPWAILEAARYALEKDERLMIIEELLHLAEFERKQSKANPIQPNDGKRAYQVLEKIIFNGPGFYVRFDNEAEIVANKVIESWKKGKVVTSEEGYAVRCLLNPLISLERENTRFEKGKIYINRYLINPDHPISQIRTRILENLWGLLAKPTHEHARLVVLDLLQDNHRDTHNGTARAKTRQGADIYEKEALNDLSRIQGFLTETWVTGAELRQARLLWNWHLSYDTREEYKSLAEECEQKYLSRPNSQLFNRVFDYSYQRESDAGDAAKELAQQITKDPSGKLIEQMLSEALEFAGGDRFWHGASLVSSELGKVLLSTPAVSTFTWSNIGSANQTSRMFAAAILSEHLRSLRQENKTTEQNEILQKAKTIVGKEGLYALMLDFYFRARFGLTGGLNPIDQAFYRSHLDELLQQTDRAELIEIATKFLPLGWDPVKTDIEKCLRGLRGDALSRAVSTTIDSIHMQLNFHKDIPVTRENAKWVFDLLIPLPKIDECGSKVEWDLQQISQKSSFKYSISEFALFLEERIRLALASPEEEERFQILPSEIMFKFFQFVDTATKTQDSKTEVEQVIRRLLELNDKPYPVGYYLPEWIASLDPLGETVPDLVLEKLEEAKRTNDIELVRSWARYAGEYHETTPQWRKIALSVSEFASKIADPKEKNGLLWSVSYKEMESWSGTYGEFHPRWQEAVEREEKRVKEETDDNLRQFFDLKLRAAKNDLEREKLRHTEEHSDE